MNFRSIALASFGASLLALVTPALAQEVSLKGAIDIHVHAGPDGVDRAIDADDLARLAKSMGMRGMVLKSHWEKTSTMAYLMRKAVPGIELFGGVTSDLANGGINIEAVKHMADVKGHYGRVVWLPTFDNETPDKVAKHQPVVPVSKDGKLLPNVLALIDYIATRPELMLETGHVTPEEGLMMIHEAHARGVKHIVVTHAMSSRWTIAQMQEGAKDGAYMEFVYPRGAPMIAQYADAMKQVGYDHCIMATDLGGVRSPPDPLEPQGFLAFMQMMQQAGVAVDDLNRMSKINPALALGLPPN
jgi:hypothetical protein